MRYIRYLMVVPLIVTLCIATVRAESPETEALHDKVDKLERELAELKDLLRQQVEKDAQEEREIAELREEVQRGVPGYPEIPYAETAPEEPYFAAKAAELEKKKLGPAFGGPYTKPFLRRFGRNTYLGGYMDFEFWQSEDDDGKHGFDQHRFIPFIYSDISDRVKLAAEIEFEHGGVEGGREGEVILEFATIDFLITEWINYRGGFILSPLGKFNLVHDSPLQDLTDRPLVNQFIIPTTLTDAGMGFFGSFYPTELSKIDYEMYATNGVFRGLEEDGTANFGLGSGLRGGRDIFEFDGANQSPAFVGRVAYSPFIGLEFGGSVLTQRYDEGNENQLTIPAFDFAYQRGAFELVGEGAYAFIETNSDAEAAGIADSMWGYYVEGRYHFMPPALRTMAPKFFTENSTFTGVVRWDQVQTSALDAGERINHLRTRITPGINYRYTEDTVFKFDYQINIEQKDLDDIANNNFVFSVATYF
ncbi:MAG: hypothetical protein E3K32_12210 [wastewater metagenome]|nr:hypothetical protein [Candidatus Loosdrechtia aerotolerans]